MNLCPNQARLQLWCIVQYTLTCTCSLTSLGASCQRLRSLDLGKSSVTDSGLVSLGRSLPSLRKVSLRGCTGVGEAGLLALAAACPALQTLSVGQLQGVSRGAIRGVQALCTDCIIDM